MACYTVEKAEFDNFQKKWQNGDYKWLRYGQAFYNHFNLGRMADQDSLKGLYERDGIVAEKLIHELFEMS